MQKTFNFFYAFLLAVLGFGVTLMAEDITLTTYYPAPYGVYKELTTTDNTYLATTSGNVGIGTTNPTEKLDMENGNIGDVNTIKSKPGAQPLRLQAMGSLLLSADANNDDTTSRINFYIDGEGDAYMKMTINPSGYVGIGTTDPGAYRLNVNGDTIVDRIYTRAATTAHGTGHNFNDIAEDIMAEGCETADVVVIDPINKGKVIKSTKPYDTSVAGIISETPAFYIGKRGQKPYLPLALAGRVLCKVSLENGPIKHGDLLTSSVTPGHAMKATDKKKTHGAIVAKALDTFEGGPNGEKIGKIMVLITLQ